MNADERALIEIELRNVVERENKLIVKEQVLMAQLDGVQARRRKLVAQRHRLMKLDDELRVTYMLSNHEHKILISRKEAS